MGWADTFREGEGRVPTKLTVFAGGFLFGILGSKRLGLQRRTVVLVATLVGLATFAGVFLNLPAEASLRRTDAGALLGPSLPLALACGLLLGFSDAIWNTQVFAFLLSHFKETSTQAFALFKFFQSLVACLIFFGSSVLSLRTHLVMLALGSCLSCACFVLADRVSLVRRQGVDNEAAEHSD